jgi:phytoene dehydrogenase-like protein
MDYDAVVVGSGIAGLVAASYTARAGLSTLLCEKQSTCGGLVQTYERGGFYYDAGIRALESSGVLLPMLRDLGIEIAFVPNPVSLGIGDRVIRLDSLESLDAYQALLTGLFPANRDDIVAIVGQIRRAVSYLDVLYGIENPAFLDIKRDRDYFVTRILPWMFKYLFTVPKINALGEPVAEYLRRFTQNQALIDIIAQHFFQATPAFFALSYLSLYLDYHYPLGGTGTLTQRLVGYIKDHGGEIRTNTRVVAVDPESRTVTDAQGNTFGYKQLIWAADLKALYGSLNPDAILDTAIRDAVIERSAAIQGKAGGDSIFTLNLALDLDKSYFQSRMTAHTFYTPSLEGQSQAGPLPIGRDRQAIERWLSAYLRLTTYEIACPVMRDPSMAPAGKTGLIVSVLFDYRLTEQIEAAGWYEEFKEYCSQCILDVLDGSLLPGIKGAVIERFSSTPLSIARAVGTTDGAITGWAFTNASIPAEHRMMKIASAVRTPVPGILQAGQWTFSPSGLPTAILTGKLAADAAQAALKRAR